MKTLSIVIPAYNEESGISDIVHRVLAVDDDLQKVDVDLVEILVVNDGSKDLTAQITSDIAREDPRVKLVNHETNKGYGAALKTGFAQAQGDLIGFLDADGTYPPEYYPALCQPAMNGSDIVIGTRMAGADSQMPVTRRIGNTFFATFLRLLSQQQITDSASGMRVFKREVLATIEPLPDGLNLTPVMSARALHEGVEMTEVPIPYSERVGRSKLSVVKDGSLFLGSITWTVLTYNPVSILGIIGLGGIAVALLVGLGLVLARLSGVTSIGPWGVVALYWGLVSGVTGISLFALGATFNYLVSLFYRRPIRRGLFGRQLFNPSLDHHFGWMGAAALVVGIIIAFVALLLGLDGWELARIWLYLLGSAMLILTGVQLVIYWLLMRVLEELSQREMAFDKS
jgi:hypothetical protein